MNTSRILTPLIGVLSAVVFFTASGQVQAGDNDLGKALIPMCLACHGDTQAGQKRLAPPMRMVKIRYQSLGKAEMVKAITDWAKKPDAKKSRMPGAVRIFGLMPALPLPDDNLKAIAEYIYDTEFAMPKGCGPVAVKAAQAKKGPQAKAKGAAVKGNAGCAPTNCDPTDCDPTACGPRAGRGLGRRAAKGKPQVVKPTPKAK